MVHELHVLVVDGEPATRDQIAGMLEAAGLDVSVATGPADAERALSTYAIDVVVSAADPPAPALLEPRRNRLTPPVIAVHAGPIHGLMLLAAIRDVAPDE